MFKHLSCLVAFLVSSPVMAAGPLVLEGPAGNTPVSYENPNIIFNIESGPLDADTDNDAADQLVRDAFALWNNIPTSIINLTQGNDIPADINGDNFNSYIPDPDPNSGIHNDNDCLNPIVYDSDGSIIDAFFGNNASNNVVGFAASSLFIGDSYFTEGFAVINGKTFVPPLTDNELTLIIAHELGHAFGLDHSQADMDNTEEFLSNSCNTAPNLAYPLMYPWACRDRQDLHPDDVLSLSMLYPVSNYYATHGQISGQFLAGTAPVLGANLWVKDVSTGAVYSIVSDYLKQRTGFFSLMLPEGTYELHANSINDEFFSGSSVGPYANDMNDLSFQAPADSIGFVTFVADGILPERLIITAGEATVVTFNTDGSGSVTEHKPIADLSPTHDTAAVCTITSPSGGGGIPSLPLLAALFCIPVLRTFARRVS